MATVTMPRNWKFTLCPNIFKKLTSNILLLEIFFPFCVRHIALLCLDLSEEFKFVSCNDFVSIFLFFSWIYWVESNCERIQQIFMAENDLGLKRLWMAASTCRAWPWGLEATKLKISLNYCTIISHLCSKFLSAQILF